jgi:hypothetical protein
MSSTDNYLSPSEILMYQLRLDNAGNQYNHGSAYNTYQKSLLENSNNAALGDMRRQWAQNFTNTQGSFARRGLGDSGIYRRGLENWRMNKQSAFGNLDRSFQAARNGLDYQQQNLGDARDASINTTNLDRQARQGEYAAAIRGAMG